MLKSILKVQGVQKLSSQQQKNIIGGEEEEGPEDNGINCVVSALCPGGTPPSWTPGCEIGCQVGYCQDGSTVTRSCGSSGF